MTFDSWANLHDKTPHFKGTFDSEKREKWSDLDSEFYLNLSPECAALATISVKSTRDNSGSGSTHFSNWDSPMPLHAGHFWLPDQNSFHYETCLGKGGFGAVYRARTSGGGPPYAIKEILNDNAQRKLSAIREKEALKAVKSPFIPKLYATFSTSEKLYLMMELVEGDNLWKCMNNY